MMLIAVYLFMAVVLSVMLFKVLESIQPGLWKKVAVPIVGLAVGMVALLMGAAAGEIWWGLGLLLLLVSSYLVHQEIARAEEDSTG